MKEDKEMSNDNTTDFKIGDKVIVSWSGYNTIGRIVEIDPDYYRVKLLSGETIIRFKPDIELL